MSKDAAQFPTPAGRLAVVVALVLLLAAITLGLRIVLRTLAPPARA